MMMMMMIIIIIIIIIILSNIGKRTIHRVMTACVFNYTLTYARK